MPLDSPQSDQLVAPERKPLKPGKWYGIIALLCGVEGPLAILATFVIGFLIARNLIAVPPLPFRVLVLICISPLCPIAGIVFGIWGRETEGRFYAYTGLVLSALYLPVSLFFGSMLVYYFFFPCC